MPTKCSMLVLLLLLFISLIGTAAQSPSPSPESSPSPSPDSGSPASSPSPMFDSPPEPTPSSSDLMRSSPASAPAPAGLAPLLAPSKRAYAADVYDQVVVSDDSTGTGGGKKAGIAFGLVAAVCMVGFGGMIYRKRRENIRRARYRYVAETELLGKNTGP